ncbi:NYN domain-containing protein [Aquabacterium sp. J223]|uniref:NYN domain-containing protein n=1 Tax=Aquabacterium sp. J223 TaxID=2898431 RepID=UPI0021ADF257|nr:NYN domain-containing protein [Aquabacterium sp. J223]UUX96748.1 NYN domain-containing protein [Aquabacterium sp. J223]
MNLPRDDRLHATRIALLIDADNSPAAKIDVILAELAKYGVANIRRAYGNWKKNELKGWEAVLHEHAIRPVQQFDHSKGKNATDMVMAIEALDLLYTDRPECFGLVSSDADFTPLVMHLRAKGATVLGFGAKKTPAPFVNACSSFLYLENLGEAPAPDPAQPAAEPAEDATAIGKRLRGDAKLVSLLRNAVDSAAGEDGWSSLSAVRNHIANQASFDPRNHGFRKFSDLVEASGLFDLERREKSVFVRDRRGEGAADARPPTPRRRAPRRQAESAGRKPSIDR